MSHTSSGDICTVQKGSLILCSYLQIIFLITTYFLIGRSFQIQFELILKISRNFPVQIGSVSEYDSFVEGIEEAIKIEEQNIRNGKTGPFSQLLKYKPGTEGAGVFPSAGIWFLDMFRVLYGLKGHKGDEMRKAELSVYDGIPFSFSGRKKINSINEKGGSSVKDRDVIVANYWRDKIRNEAKNRLKGKWLPLRFIFTEKDLEYHDEYMKRTIKDE